jgi:hypothetical protein
LPDGTSPRPASDTQQLLKLMSMRSEIVEMRLTAVPDSEGQAIEELPPAAPTVLDHLVQARVRTEEEALAAAPTSPPDLQPSEDWAADEEAATLEAGELPPDELAVDLLELNAAEAGQPAEIEPLDTPAFQPSVAHGETKPQTEQSVERDHLLAQPLEVIEETTILVEDEPAPHDALSSSAAAEGDQPAGAEAIEELPPAEAGPHEGAGDDFQALLAGARQLEPEPAAPRGAAEDEEVPLLPADGDVKLRARNGPKPGAEFVGKSTLAGATGLYCLIERFNLPAGTRMKLTLTAPRFTDRFDVEDAVVKRVRRAPGNTAEVQLAFEQRHQDFEEFVARHFGDKPVGFSFFSRRRPKR